MEGESRGGEEIERQPPHIGEATQQMALLNFLIQEAADGGAGSWSESEFMENSRREKNLGILPTKGTKNSCENLEG